MANIEMDTLLKRQSENGDLEIHYPITRVENVLDLDEKIQKVSNAEETKEKLGDISEGIETLKERISSRAAAETALSSETWTEERAERLDERISSRAAAETALSSETWTEERAAVLDSIPSIEYKMEALDSSINTIYRLVRSLWEDKNIYYEYKESESEKYTVVTRYELIGVTGGISGNAMKGKHSVAFTAKCSGKIAVRFTGSSTAYHTNGNAAAYVYGIMYKYTGISIPQVDLQAFAGTGVSTSNLPDLPGFKRTILASNSASGSTSATTSFTDKWYEVKVEEGDILIFTAAVAGTYKTSKGEETAFTGNADMYLGYDIKVKDFD